MQIRKIMNNQEMQHRLNYVTKIMIENFNSNKIKGATAIWKDNTAHISIYFDKKPSEKEIEDVSVICSEIIAQMPTGMLEENFIFLDQPNKLPKYLAYRRD